MKSIGRQLVLCAGCGIIDLLLFGLLLRTPLFKDVTIYYYRILYLVIVSTVISLTLFIGIHFLFKKKLARISFWQISPVEIFSTTVICTLCMALIVSVVSMPLDRSYTIYSLVDMADNPNKSYTIEEIEKQFIDGYIDGMDATQRRINEQVSIGNISEVDGSYQITSKGIKQVELFRFYEKVFPIQEKRILYPRESKSQ